MPGARHAVAIVLLLSWIPSITVAEPLESDAGVTAFFVQYYSAVTRERWTDAFQLLHERLRTATEVRSPEEMAQKHLQDQHRLIQAFETFDRIEVTRTEMDLSSIRGYVKAWGEGGNIAGEVTYDLLVFLKGPGHPRMYRVVTDVGLSDGRIIRITQHSIDRIDPEGLGDTV